MREIWLHVGATKTGSSAIQTAAVVNRKALLSRGVFYPASGADDAAARGGATSGNGGLLTEHLRSSERDARFDTAVSWLSGAMALGHERILISSELMQWAELARMEELVAWIQAEGWRVRIIFYVRHVADHAVSSYGQAVKSGLAVDQNVFLSNYVSPLLQVPEFARIVGADNIIVRSYDVEKSQLIDRFFGLFANDWSVDEIVQPGLVNRSATADESATFRQLGADLNPDGSRIWQRFIRDASNDYLRSNPGPSGPMTISPDALAMLSERFQRVVTDIDATYFAGAGALRMHSDEMVIGDLNTGRVDDSLSSVLRAAVDVKRVERTRYRAMIKAYEKGELAPGVTPPRTMLFVRTFKRATGGHQKVRDYMGHVAASGLFKPLLYLTPASDLDRARAFFPEVETVDRLVSCDAYFLGVLDWPVLEQEGALPLSKPVVNLIQHVRYADQDDPRRKFFRQEALRICVSHEAAQAVEATGDARGPVIAIENGIDLQPLRDMRPADAGAKIFVGGLKRRGLAKAVAQELERLGYDVDLAIEHMERSGYLMRIATARIAILLPNASEGFYLPPLEAMALETPVIVPDCVGNRRFCLPEENCLMPEATVDALVLAAVRLASSAELRAKLTTAGAATTSGYDLSRERSQFVSALTTYLDRGAAGFVSAATLSRS